MVEAAVQIKAIAFGVMIILIYLYSAFQVIYKTIKFFKWLGVEKRYRSLLRLAEVVINSFIWILLGLFVVPVIVFNLGGL